MNDEAEYTEQANLLLAYVHIIATAEIDLDWLIETARYTDAVGPIVDPSAFQRSTADYRTVAELARLLKPFRERAVELLTVTTKEQTK